MAQYLGSSNPYMTVLGMYMQFFSIQRFQPFTVFKILKVDFARNDMVNQNIDKPGFIFWLQ